MWGYFAEVGFLESHCSLLQWLWLALEGFPCHQSFLGHVTILNHNAIVSISLISLFHAILFLQSSYKFLPEIVSLPYPQQSAKSPNIKQNIKSLLIMPSLRKSLRDLASKAAYELKAELKAHVSPPQPISKYGDERRREADRRYRSQDYRPDDPNFMRLRGGGIEYRGRVSLDDIPLSDLLGYSPWMDESDDCHDRSLSKNYSNVTEKARKAEKDARCKKARISEEARISEKARMSEKARKSAWAAADETEATAVAGRSEARRTKVRFEETNPLERAHLLEKAHLFDEDESPEKENPFESTGGILCKRWREEQQEAKQAVQEQRELKAQEEESKWRREVGIARVEEWLDGVIIDDEQMAMN